MLFGLSWLPQKELVLLLDASSNKHSIISLTIFFIFWALSNSLSWQIVIGIFHDIVSLFLTYEFDNPFCLSFIIHLTNVFFSWVIIERHRNEQNHPKNVKQQIDDIAIKTEQLGKPTRLVLSTWVETQKSEELRWVSCTKCLLFRS